MLLNSALPLVSCANNRSTLRTSSAMIASAVDGSPVAQICIHVFCLTTASFLSDTRAGNQARGAGHSAVAVHQEHCPLDHIHIARNSVCLARLRHTPASCPINLTLTFACVCLTHDCHACHMCKLTAACNLHKSDVAQSEQSGQLLSEHMS